MAGAARIVSIVRKQQINNVPSWLSPLYEIQDLALGLGPPMFSVDLPASINLFPISSPRRAPEACPPDDSRSYQVGNWEDTPQLPGTGSQAGRLARCFFLKKSH